MNKSINTQLVIPVAIVLVLLGAIARLAPHPANFAPLGAIALFGGLYLPRRFAVITTLSSLFLSDIIIGFYNWKIMLVVYISFATIAWISTKIKHSFGTILTTSLLSSILFFITTNAAVWAFGTMYAHTVSGLVQCYAMALPFFRNSVLGDLFYTGIFVTTYQLVVRANLPLLHNKGKELA
jgi:hypothetical protein